MSDSPVGSPVDGASTHRALAPGRWTRRVPTSACATDERHTKGVSVSATGSVGSHLARLLPDAASSTVERLEQAARQQDFARRDVLHARGMQMPPFVLLDGHVMYRRVVETGQVRAALIAGPGYMGGLRSISSPGADALYELVALTDGTWATWDPTVIRALALADAALAVDLLDLLVRVRRRAQRATRRTVVRECAPAHGRHPDAVWGCDLRHAPSGSPARRPGGHDRHQSRDDVPDIARARSRRPRETPPRWRDQHRGPRAARANWSTWRRLDEAPAL